MISDQKYRYALATDRDITYVLFNQPLTQSQNFRLCSLLKEAWLEIDKSSRVNLVTKRHYQQHDVVKLALQKFENETNISGEIIPSPTYGTVWYDMPRLN